VVVLNKTDAIDPKDVAEYRAEFADAGIELLSMSAATGEGIDTVLEKLWTFVHA
jgi:50S ribosomal subunit-associated GTPase HflX